MLRAGIVGLPNVGKSTLFNALTRTRKAEAANYPFCTIEPNVGVVTVPDARLDTLAAISRTTKIVPTTIEFVDIAGLVKGASQGEGLGNKFLQHIREVDAIVEVVRCFESGTSSTSRGASNRWATSSGQDRAGARGPRHGGALPDKRRKDGAGRRQRSRRRPRRAEKLEATWTPASGPPPGADPAPRRSIAGGSSC